MWCQIIAVLFEHNMIIGATKAKCTHRRTAWMLSTAHPRSRLAIDIKRCRLDRKFWMRVLNVDRRWQYPMMECQRGLDQPGGTGRRLGVADLRFDAAECNPAFITRFAKHPCQRGKLGLIPCHGAGAMRLDQINTRGRYAGIGIRAPQRELLALCARCVDAAKPSITRCTDATDDRIHAVTIALGIGEALEHQHADTLAHRHTIGRCVEWPWCAALRESGRLAKAQIDKRRIVGIDTASNHHIDAPHLELAYRHPQRRQPARTGRIDDAVQPAQIEPIGNPASNHIAEHARETVLFPADVRRFNPRDNRRGLIFRNPRGT